MIPASNADYELLYQAFREISRVVHASQTSREVFERIVWKSTEVLNAKGAKLRICNPETGEFEVAAACGIGEKYLLKGPVSKDVILADLEDPGHVVVIDDIWNAPRVEHPQDAWDEGIRMMIDVPLSIGLDVVGLIRIYLSEKRDFSAEEKRFLVYVAEQCACAINKMRTIESQQERYDKLALQTEKMAALGRMAAGIAHEINNPLAGILLFSSNLVKKVDDGTVKEGLEIIIRESTRCKTIIQDLLEFSRNTEAQRRPANINTTIEKALRILENEFRLKHVKLEKALADTIADTLLDENQFEQLIINLLLNAVQAVDENGTIGIETRMIAGGRRLTVAISDNGCGIPEAHRSHIFEPFFSTKKNGTGLGLAVSYGIVQNHQGDLEVFSKPGEGTRIVISLPILHHAEAAG